MGADLLTLSCYTAMQLYNKHCVTEVEPKTLRADLENFFWQLVESRIVELHVA